VRQSFHGKQRASDEHRGGDPAQRICQRIDRGGEERRLPRVIGGSTAQARVLMRTFLFSWCPTESNGPDRRQRVRATQALTFAVCSSYALGLLAHPSRASGGFMDHKAFFLKQWDKEAAATRKVISRIPQSACEYRADPKARTARELAWVIVQEEIALGKGMKQATFEWAEVPVPATMEEIVGTYDREHDQVTKSLGDVDQSTWEGRVPFMYEGKEIMRETGYDMAWGFLLDMIHHRGQLSTYLRPMGATVPAIYGPSADEGS
jgi:uncharacterized damage-inducible protein DinB